MIELRKEFDNTQIWLDLAKRFYIRLPKWGTKVDEQAMRKWLRKFRISESDYLEMTGYEKLTDFIKLNPDWPLRAFVGLLLKYVADRDDAKGVLRAYDRNDRN